MKIYLHASIVLVLLFLSSCRKDVDTFIPYPLDGKISSLLDGVNGDDKLTSIVVGESTNIDLQAGSYLKIAESSIESEKDIIEIKMKALDNSRDMLLNFLPTFINSSFLSPQIALEINLEEGAVISPQSPIKLFVETPELDVAKLFVFRGNEWNESTGQSMSFIEWMDEGGILKTGYEINITANGWYSLATLDHHGSLDGGRLCLQLSGEKTDANTKAFLMTNDGLALPMAKEKDGLFCNQVDLFSGVEGQLVVLSSVRKGEYQIGVSELTISDGLAISPTLEMKKIEEIKMILQGL